MLVNWYGVRASSVFLPHKYGSRRLTHGVRVFSQLQEVMLGRRCAEKQSISVNDTDADTAVSVAAFYTLRQRFLTLTGRFTKKETHPILVNNNLSRSDMSCKASSVTKPSKLLLVLAQEPHTVLTASTVRVQNAQRDRRNQIVFGLTRR